MAALRSQTNHHRGNIFGYDRRIKTLLSGGRNPRPLSTFELQDFGHHLFEVLLPDDVRRLYDVARSRESGSLFMVFTSMIPWVADLPWEFARDPERGTNLTTQDTHFIRNVLTPTPVEKRVPTERLRILVVSSEPEGFARLSTTEELAKLRHELRLLEGQGVITFDELHRATAQELHGKIVTGDFDVVHFIGHGFWNKSNGESGLVMEDGRGGAAHLGGQPLREVLANRGLRMVFLNACDTGRGRSHAQGVDRSFGGVAQDLFALGVPNVIANQFPVGDRAAVAFARAFYSFLGQGKTIAEAVRESRIAVNLVQWSEPMDWAIPVAYARDPEDRFITRVPSSSLS